ncbi:MAG: flagellar hook basal-body protein [Acidobacteria bacterium]|nr:flagellar hook basal-body protein [Acidobacteriota bacterium]
MAGGYYAALSGMRTRLEMLDRLASDIANAQTAGYKSERAATNEATRQKFGAELQSAIDVVSGKAQLDLRAGVQAPTGRNLDVAVGGNGFFEIETAAGPRYTRNGRFTRREDGVLATADGEAVMGTSGPITLGSGVVEVDADGTVRHNGATAGVLKVVEFDKGAVLVRETALRVRNDGTPATEVERPVVRAGALEQSNVSIVDRLAELTTASRTFEALQRSLSVLMNDVDSRAITELGRR